MQDPILVTGGAGFIGSNFILREMQEETSAVLNLDKLTYAGNPHNLESIVGDPRYEFVREDIGNRPAVAALLKKHQPSAIVHFAAESHVDRSIRGPEDFIRTNVDGTFALLEETRSYWEALPEEERKKFRFLQVSTDEVYGSLGPDDPAFCESTAYAPNSPYAASKAASDHLVRAYHHTYGLPTLTTNCSNNYGRFQFPEKLIPLMILNARDGKSLPVYGDGKNVMSRHANGSRRDLITFVKDRPGHDRRYAIDARKIELELGWKPKETLETGLRKTVRWYLDNEAWVRNVVSGSYREWIATHYTA
jgi:dTDP-glucose 4,6-dehydratase